MELNEEKISGKLAYDGALLKVNRDIIKLPNGEESVREWINHPGASAVIPLVGNDRVVMVKQFRYPLGRVTLEIPAGKLDPGESPLECAKRELREETGLSGGDFHRLGKLVTTPAFTNEIIYLFLAKNLSTNRRRNGITETDADEFVSLVEMTPKEVITQITSGNILDAKTIIAFLLADKLGLF